MIVIPRIIHHVWPGADPFKPELHAFRATWLRHHPDWSFIFWRKNFPWIGQKLLGDVRVMHLLEDSRYTVTVKSDVLRYWVLWEFGGLYVDTDFECLRPFDELLDDSNGFFCGKENQAFCSPSLMGAVARHPLVLALLEESLARIGKTSVEVCNAKPNEITGPHLLTKLVSERGRATVYAPEFFYPIPGPEIEQRRNEAAPNAFAKHHFYGWSEGGWAKKQVFG
jgi:mannosyltransferase OCH1-like enzyme